MNLSLSSSPLDLANIFRDMDIVRPQRNSNLEAAQYSSDRVFRIQYFHARKKKNKKTKRRNEREKRKRVCSNVSRIFYALFLFVPLRTHRFSKLPSSTANTAHRDIAYRRYRSQRTETLPQPLDENKIFEGRGIPFGNMDFSLLEIKKGNLISRSPISLKLLIKSSYQYFRECNFCAVGKMV